MLRRLRDTNAGMIWRAVRMFLAMLIAWHTINAMRGPGSKHFTRGFVVCAPGLTSHKLDNANSVSALRRRLSGRVVTLTPASIDLADELWAGAIPSEWP